MGFLGNLELGQLQFQVVLVKFKVFRIVLLTRVVMLRTVALRGVVKFWKSLGSAVAFLVIH